MPDNRIIRVAMWSGPRNISTAMMRAWGDRTDTVVIDEPFYAYYLNATGKRHPGAEEIIATGEIEWNQVIARLTGPIPNGKSIFFQKQMTHHLLPEVDLQWIADLKNCFLIRDPREVILSYIKKNSEPALEDLGFVQQQRIFDFARRETGSVPPVIDARDVLENPERVLRLLCETLAVDFEDAMLSWPPGTRETDGVWAKHWYEEVIRSTSFQPYQAREGIIPDRLHEIHEQCRKCYERLYENRLH